MRNPAARLTQQRLDLLRIWCWTRYWLNLAPKKNWLGSMLAENAWSADSEWGGVKALCGAAQEWRHLLDGTIYPPVQLPHLNTTSPSRERASRAPLPCAPQSLHLIPILLVPMGAPSCMVDNGSRSPRLHYPLTALFARKTMLCLHPTIVAYALDIMERLRPEQHSPCNGTLCAYDGRC